MNFSSIFLIQITITVLFCILAAICDVRDNFIPEKLTYILLFFGLDFKLDFINYSQTTLNSF